MGAPRIGRSVTELMKADIVPESAEARDMFGPNNAADIFLNFLPSLTQEKIRHVSSALDLPVWQILLGYVVKVVDSGEAFNPIILSDWERLLSPSEARQCVGCGLTFTSPYPDARSCCNHCAFDKVSERGHSEGCVAR